VESSAAYLDVGLGFSVTLALAEDAVAAADDSGGEGADAQETDTALISVTLEEPETAVTTERLGFVPQHAPWQSVECGADEEDDEEGADSAGKDGQDARGLQQTPAHMGGWSEVLAEEERGEGAGLGEQHGEVHLNPSMGGRETTGVTTVDAVAANCDALFTALEAPSDVCRETKSFSVTPPLHCVSNASLSSMSEDSVIISFSSSSQVTVKG